MDFLGLERPVEYTGYSIFDPTTAKMVLDAQDKYFAAVYADYQQGLEDMKEFRKEYDDFITPILADQEWYNNNVTGKVRGFINDAYARGIDLTRSQEGRAALAQIINSVNVGKIAKIRQSAENAKEYIKNRGLLEAAGKYNDDMERGFLGFDLNNWSTLGNGIWNRTSPIEAATLQQLTKNAYEGRQARLLSAVDFEDERLKGKYQYDPKYEWSGYLYSDLLKGAPGAILSNSADPRMQYFRHLAEQKVAASGQPYTQADVEAQFQRDVADANTWALIDPTREANQFALDDHRTANEDWLDSRKQYREDYYKRQYAKDHPTSTETGGYDLLGDFYSTTLAQAAGKAYFPQEGATPETLGQWLEDAKEIQKRKIKGTEHVLDATGMFMSPEKIRGIIPSNGKNGNGEFLDRNYFDNLYTEDDVRSSYDGWRMKGRTEQESREWREKYQEESKQIRDAVLNWNKSNGYDYKLKVVPEKDKNGNNTYGVVGSDGRWHTYARVRVYMSDGKKSTLPVADRSDNSKKFIPAEGKVMLLEVGLKSNENAASPDLSISAREEVGPYAFNTVKKWTGLTGNKSFPWGANGFSSK